MKRLTDKITNRESGEVLAYMLKRDVSTIQANRKLGELEDLEEQGLLLKEEDAVDEGHLQDWYIHSVCEDDKPVWTEAHIAELFNDFILIPRAEAEKALAEMKGE